MQGMVNSLNVSVANAIILFEAQRQRLKAGIYEECQLDKITYEKLLFEYSYPDLGEVLRNQGKQYPDLDNEGYIINH